MNPNTVDLSSVSINIDRIGNVVLVGGTATVTMASITANSVIFLTRKIIGGTTGNLSYTISAGDSFDIDSSNNLDTSTISYLVIN